MGTAAAENPRGGQHSGWRPPVEAGREPAAARLRYNDRVSLSASLIEDFERDGYVVVPDLLSNDELDEFGPHVDAAVARRTRGDPRALHEKSPYQQSFDQCINLWEDCPEVRPLTFHLALAETAAHLLGVAGVRVWHDQALYKQPGGRGTDPHCDLPYWPIEETEAVTAWIPFDGSTLENGAMGYVPGSHLFGERRFANIFSGRGFDLENGPEAHGRKPVFVEVPRGGVAFHHGLSIHLAGPNQHPETRRVHTVIYFADGSTRAKNPKLRHPCVDRAGIAPGAPVISDVTPMAWPRAGADLPTPPARPDPPLLGWPR